MKDIIDLVVLILSIALIGYGVWQISPAWSLITIGSILFGLVIAVRLLPFLLRGKG